jgi:hypothetical protein
MVWLDGSLLYPAMFLTLRQSVAEKLAKMQGTRWLMGCACSLALPEHDLRDNIAHDGDNVLMATL